MELKTQDRNAAALLKVMWNTVGTFLPGFSHFDRRVFKDDLSCHLPRDSCCVYFADIKMVMIGEWLCRQLTSGF